VRVTPMLAHQDLGVERAQQRGHDRVERPQPGRVVPFTPLPTVADADETIAGVVTDQD